ncbi:DNA polymerase Y family protein [Methylovirgula sp. HY1]|uniref:Y-family DNA polymerase n=1 Tax=Methylovirgula sp. HY1 TaxID=2822761 RepID=UPI001C5A6863|nr:DNA polymerase Y family protein [Methylovirgula sp. HY1]
MRYLSLWLPSLASDRIVRRWRGDEGAPLRLIATIAKIKNAQRLVAVDAAAAACGLKPGMMLADARAMAPDLRCFPADAAAEAASLCDITDWCRRFTPLAALDAPDGVMLDVSGAAHLFGGEKKLLAEIEGSLAAQGFAARAALAPTVEAAWALARFGRERRLPALLSECGETDLARRLGPLPLAALRLEEHMLAGLAQAGLRRIDDLLLRPRAPLAARFGSSLFDRLDGLLGRAKKPISPRFEAPAYLVERRFAETLIRREDAEATILALAKEMLQLLTRHGEGARSLDLSLFRVDGAVNHIEIGLSRPSRDPQMIARLFRAKIEALCAKSEDDPLDAGFGFDVVRLSALSVERLDQAQTHWLGQDLGQEQERGDLADLVDRLGARLGLRRVTRLAFADTHSPEFAVTVVPAAHAPLPVSASETGRGQVRSRNVGVNPLAPHPNPLPVNGESETCLPHRPLRLLPRPEPIETIASVPDGPPLRFRWRRVLHEIAAIEGPERIAPEWWKNEPTLTRDYFRAEDREGQRFWLFREGLYETEIMAPRWFMHGLFA